MSTTAIVPRPFTTAKRLRPEKKLKPITPINDVLLYEATRATKIATKSIHYMVIVYLVTLYVGISLLVLLSLR